MCLCNGVMVEPGGEHWDGMRVPGPALGKLLNAEYCCTHPEGVERASRACGTWLVVLVYGDGLRSPENASGNCAAPG